MTDVKRQDMLERISTAIDNNKAHESIDLGDGYSAIFQITYGIVDGGGDVIEIFINDKDDYTIETANVSGGPFEFENADAKEAMKELANEAIKNAEFEVSDSGPSL